MLIKHVLSLPLSQDLHNVESAELAVQESTPSKGLKVTTLLNPNPTVLWEDYNKRARQGHFFLKMAKTFQNSDEKYMQ